MSNPITAADLAEALRKLMDVVFDPVGINKRVRVFDESADLLARFDAQQADARKLATAVNATGLGRIYIVELQEGCWVADGDGDPPRTLVESNAKFFETRVRATRALADARKYRPFRNAKIVGIDRNPQAIEVTQKRIGGTNAT